MTIKPREQFAKTVESLGSRDKDLVVIVGDISHGIMKKFAKKFPKRYYNIGICEPSTVNLCSGLSITGLNPVVHTIAPFLIERSYEQIKLDFGYQKKSLNLVSVGSSFDYSKLGCSHHCYTDVSLISHFKNSIITLPSSAIEFDVLFKSIYKKNSIKYFRLTDNPHNVNFNKKEIKFGKGIKVFNGKDITIVALGPQLNNAITVKNKLAKIGISAEVLYYHTFKPFDSKLLLSSVKKTKKLVTLEELSKYGGMYHLILDLTKDLLGLSIKQIAINDFIHGYGSYEDLCNKSGLSSKNLLKEALNLIKN